MKALVMQAIGELRVVDVPEPEITAPDQAIVEIAAAGICGSDLHGYTGQTGRRKPPLIMGHEASGMVVELGSEVDGIGLGDRVAIQPLMTLGGKRHLLGMDAPGAYAERVALPAANLRAIPHSLSFTEAAMAEPLAVAVRALKKIDLQADGAAMVVGSGAIGLLIAQLARAHGWNPVLVSDISPERLIIAGRLGFVPVNAADSKQWRSVIDKYTSGLGVEVAFEAVGSSKSVSQAHEAVQYGGHVVWVGNNAKLIELDMQLAVTRELTVHGTYGLDSDDFATALDKLVARSVDVGHILNRFAALEEGPELFDELLSSPRLIKGMFVFGA